jgi:microcystin-dependent protein
MARYIFQGTFRDGQGNIVPDGTVSVCDADTTTASTLYAASSGGTSVNSVTSDDNGFFYFYIDSSDYAENSQFDITLSKSGYSDKTYEDVVIYGKGVAGVSVESVAWSGDDMVFTLTDASTITLADAKVDLAGISVENAFTASQQIEGDALLLRLNDTGTSGEEWAVRSDGGNLEIVKNTGTESAPTWTVQARIDVNALRIGNGTGSNIDIIANNDAATKPAIRYQASGSKWQYSNDGSTFNDMGSGIESSSDSMPVGSVITFAGASAPLGYLECNGAAISRATYESLFAIISTMYGAGDGSTTFNIPDYRGYFMRGWSHGSGADPDAASRIDRGDGTVGDNVGTKQSHQFYSHNHSASSTINNDISHYDGRLSIGRTNTGGKTGSVLPVMESASVGANVYEWTNNVPYEYTVSTSIGAAGGNETRPVNINVLYCIKY